MKKDNNFRVTPQNTPYLSQRKIIVSFATVSLVINLILIGILCPEGRWFALSFASIFLCYLIVNLFYKRRQEWSWFSVISSCVMYVGISFFSLLLSKLYWITYLLVAEILIFIIVVFLIFKVNFKVYLINRKRTKRRDKRRQERMSKHK